MRHARRGLYAAGGSGAIVGGTLLKTCRTTNMHAYIHTYTHMYVCTTNQVARLGWGT